MNANILSKENNIVKFTFEASAEKFEEGLKYAYNKNKSKISLPGFRKGKAPRKIIEANYGEGIFYDDAINYVLRTAYGEAIKELNLDVVAKPEVDVPKISKQEGLGFEVSVAVKPEVKLGQYKGLEFEKIDTAVSEDDVLAELKRVQEQNSRIVSVKDRPAKMEDIVKIAYLGTIDGVPFEGGEAENYDLTLGSHSFIDTFEDQIAGHKVGDKFDVNVTFPKEYHAENLAGKPAVFSVELKDITVKELPELNDEFAQDVSDFETLDEYKKDVLAKLKAEKELSAKNAKNDKLVEIASNNAEMDIPRPMIESKIEQMIQDFEYNIGQQGLSLDVYLKYIGSDMNEMKKTFEEPALKSIKARLTLEQIAKEENIEVTKEEMEQNIEEMGKRYNIDKEKMMSIIPEEDKKVMAEDLKVKKAAEIIQQYAVEVESAK